MNWILNTIPSKQRITVLAPQDISLYHLVCQVLGMLNKKEYNTQNVITKAMEKISNININNNTFKTFRDILSIFAGIKKVPLISFQYSKEVLFLLLPLLLKDGNNHTIADIPEEIENFEYYKEIFKINKIDVAPLADRYMVDGKFKPNEYKIPGDVPFEMICGLLFLFPLLDGESKITFTTKCNFQDKLKNFIEILDNYKIKINYVNNVIKIKGEQTYCSKNIKLCPNIKYVIYYLIVNVMGGDFQVTNPAVINTRINQLILKAKTAKTKHCAINFEMKDEDIEIIPFFIVMMTTLNGESTIHLTKEICENGICKNKLIASTIDILNSFGAQIFCNSKNILKIVGNPNEKFNCSKISASVDSCNIIPILLLISLHSQYTKAPLTIIDCEVGLNNSDYQNIIDDWVCGHQEYE